MKRIFMVIILLLHLLCSKSFSQANYRDGYIITLSEDTIFGQVAYRDGPEQYTSFNFKRGANTKPVNYKPEEVLGYGYINYIAYIARQVNDEYTDGKPVFMEVLVNGEVTLYKYKVYYYISKGGQEIYGLTNELIKTDITKNGLATVRNSNKYIGVLSYLLADCSSVTNMIQRTRLVEKDLTDLIESYNACGDEAYISYKNSLKWTKLNWGITGGITFATLRYDDDFTIYKIGIINDFGPVVGVVLKISFPRITEKFTVMFETKLMDLSYQETIFRSQSLNSIYYDIYVSTTTMSMPIAIRYDLFGNKTLFYMMAGLNNDINFNRESILRTEDVLYTNQGYNVSTSENNYFDIRSWQGGVLGRLGIEQRFNRFAIGLSGEYVYAGTFSGPDNMVVKNDRYVVLLTVTLL